MEAFKEAFPFGPYSLWARIALGGMAEVLLGTSDKREFQGQFLAIKRLLPHLNSNKAFVDLLIHEAKVGVLLNHPSIAAVYDLGSHKSEFFLAMEYVHGKSLDVPIKKIDQKEIPRLPLEISTYIILEVIKALSFAHQLKDSKGRELNIVHRDISPGNILVGYQGEVKLVDFGIATAESRLQQGFSESAMGKLSYMSPEQAVNEPVTRASDLYSLGVVYYQILTGQLPFQAENANSLLKKVIDGRVTDIRIVGPSVPKGIREIISACLNKSARKRFQSGPELHQAIVSAFKTELEIDFSARATREYYKKKLSEYMRSAFSADMIQELEVVQRALREAASQASQEEFKKTAPQGQVAATHEPEDLEHTAFIPDQADEATRHYPLTEDERRKIMKGLPPKEVVQKTSQIKSFGDELPREVFNSATVPEYSPKQTSMNRISVKERIHTSSLGKDHRETLVLQIPAEEIMSNDALDAFEKRTFSGAQEVEDQITHHRDREAIMKDFAEIERLNKANHAPSLPSSIYQERTSKAQEVPKPRDWMFIRTWAQLAGIALTIGALAFWGLQSLPHFIETLMDRRVPFLPTQKVYLALLGEGEASQLTQIRETLESSSSPNLKDVENLFNSEYRRYTGKSESVLSLKLGNPELLMQGISTQDNFQDLAYSTEVFKFLSPFRRRVQEEFSALIYLYVHPTVSQNADRLFPEEFIPSRDSQEGIVFISFPQKNRLSIMSSVAREVALVYGALSYRDKGLGIPMNPEGLPDPLREPRFPQSKAELMGRDIALSSLKSEAPKRFEDFAIGPYTAHRFGWISLEERGKLAP